MNRPGETEDVMDDPVEELRSGGRLAARGGPPPSEAELSVLQSTAARLEDILTREAGVDGHEVLDLMVVSLDVRGPLSLQTPRFLNATFLNISLVPQGYKTYRL